MKTRMNLKSTLISTVSVMLVASSIQLSASEYQFWREQVPSTHNESLTIDRSGGEEGSWFFKEIAINHRDQAQGQSVRGLNDVRTSSSSGSNNWFLQAIAPHYYNGDTQKDEADNT